MLLLNISLSALVDLSFDRPSNLKETIDWILRVTGKDGQDQGGNGTQELATAVSKLLSTAGVNIKPSIEINKDLIENLATGLAKFIGYGENQDNAKITGQGIAGVPKGGAKTNTQEPPWTLDDLNKARSSEKPTGYVYSYEPNVAKWTFGEPSHADAQKCAKIFLGCLPMIFSALSYLYWRCDSQGNGEWSGFSLNEDALKTFVVASGYKSSEVNRNKYGSEIFQSIKQDKFKDFDTVISGLQHTAKDRASKENAAKKKLYPKIPDPLNEKPTYPEFVSKFHDNGKEKFGNGITTSANQNSLSILYHISYLYFRGRHIMLSESSAFKPRPPSTIREMLYFMASLPLSPSYDSLNEHISHLLRTLSRVSSSAIDAEYIIPVADSGNTSPYNTLHLAAKAYLKTKFKSDSDGESDSNLKEIKNRLLEFKTSRSRSAPELKEEFDKFLNEIKLNTSVTSMPVENASKQSSTGAAAAGGVLGTAALGTTAALATNVGGITTTLKSLIPIFK